MGQSLTSHWIHTGNNLYIKKICNPTATIACAANYHFQNSTIHKKCHFRQKYQRNYLCICNISHFHLSLTCQKTVTLCHFKFAHRKPCGRKLLAASEKGV